VILPKLLLSYVPRSLFNPARTGLRLLSGSYSQPFSRCFKFILANGSCIFGYFVGKLTHCCNIITRSRHLEYEWRSIGMYLSSFCFVSIQDGEENGLSLGWMG